MESGGMWTWMAVQQRMDVRQNASAASLRLRFQGSLQRIGETSAKFGCSVTRMLMVGRMLMGLWRRYALQRPTVDLHDLVGSIRQAWTELALLCMSSKGHSAGIKRDERGVGQIVQVIGSFTWPHNFLI